MIGIKTTFGDEHEGGDEGYVRISHTAKQWYVRTVVSAC